MDILRFSHPILSGFPSALLVLLLIVEGTHLFIRKSSSNEKIIFLKSFVIIALLIGVGSAFGSGYLASYLAGDISEDAKAVISAHHSTGKILLANSVLLVTFYWLAQAAEHGKRIFKFLYAIILLAQVIITFLTGNKGGILVFDYGIGVKKSSQQQGADVM
jgi:uncharacterized membrane protein